jgi:hypothetical protein
MTFYYLFYNPAVLAVFSNLVLSLNPVILIESIASG